MNFKSKKLAIPSLLVLIFLAVGVFMTVSLGPDFWSQDFKSRFLASFSQNPFKKQSAIKVSLEDLKINLKFDLIEEDQPKFAVFVGNWFGVSEEINSLSLGIDENIKNMLSQNLPVDLKLTINEKSLGFSSNKVSSLQNALIKNDIDFATGSGRIKVKYTDASKYQLQIENPADLATYATSSGMLSASTKIEGLFKTLPKVATIELNVNGKNISGQIVLK